MDLYSIDKLMHETRQLAARYRQATGSTLPVTGEIARFDAAKSLDLQLLDNLNSSYDAVGKSGALADQKLVIKGRAIFDTSKSTPRIGQLNPAQEWDGVLLVLFDDEYQPIEIFYASKQVIQDALNDRESNRKKRGAMSIAQFKIIGERIWTAENGAEPEIWDNQAT